MVIATDSISLYSHLKMTTLYNDLSTQVKTNYWNVKKKSKAIYTLCRWQRILGKYLYDCALIKWPTVPHLRRSNDVDCDVNNTLRNVTHHTSNMPVVTVPAGILTLLGTTIFAGAAMTEFGSRNSKEPAFERLNADRHGSSHSWVGTGFNVLPNVYGVTRLSIEKRRWDQALGSVSRKILHVTWQHSCCAIYKII